mmetsp:Transcript_61569/g.158846  ORF Transcript_61569/g.158846 Transcript_61569/m.158846 type:complete len:251 (-) Transcript_61569:1013-1765(-)
MDQPGWRGRGRDGLQRHRSLQLLCGPVLRGRARLHGPSRVASPARGLRERAAAGADGVPRHDAQRPDPQPVGRGHEHPGLQPASHDGGQLCLVLALRRHRRRLHAREMVPDHPHRADVRALCSPCAQVSASHARPAPPGRGGAQPDLQPLLGDDGWCLHDPCDAAAGWRPSDQHPQDRGADGGVLPEQHGRTLAEPAAAVQRHDPGGRRLLPGHLPGQHQRPQRQLGGHCHHIRDEADGHAEPGEQGVGR